MTKKIIVISIAVVLCLSIVGACFALYKQSASKTITISAGDAIVLTSGDLSGGSIEGFALSGINPDTNKTQELRLHATGANLTGNGTLTVTASGDLAAALNFSYTYHYGESETEYTIQETELTAGTAINLSSLPANGILTFSYDTANYPDFVANAEKSASITIKWEKVDFTPVNDAYYLVGSFNGWAVNAGAIPMTDVVEGNHAANENVALTAGTVCKIVRYKADGEAVPGNIEWKPWDSVLGDEAHNYSLDSDGNYIVPSNGNYRIYFNNENIGWIEIIPEA